MKKTKAIFLDRDGVINQLVIKEGVGRAPSNLEELVIFPGVEKALIQLKNSDFLAIVVTNQPDVARGWVTRESVDLINNKILELLVIDDIKICFHTNIDKCLCRKPEPGMLLEAAVDWEINLSESYMIGDRYSDMAAGERAGCRTVLVGPGDIQGDYPNPTFQVLNLFEAVQLILKDTSF